MPSLIILILTGFLLVLGLSGTIIPGLPGIFLIYGGILLFAISTNFTSLSLTTVVIFGIIAVLAALTDLIAGLVGSKLAGGGRWSLAGAALGALLGLFFSPIGIVIGAYLGALLGALHEGRTGQHALKIAAYSFLATLGSTLVQFFLGFILIISFLLAILI